MGGGWGSESDSDDKTVWLDYHNREVKQRDERIIDLAAALEGVQQALEASVADYNAIKAERDEAVRLLTWARERMRKDREGGPAWLNELWQRANRILESKP